jgi:hypothetical protein
VWCDGCAWLRLWRRVALCSLSYNSIGDEGAAVISRGLAMVPQLQTLQYAVAVCVLVVPLQRWDPVAQGVRGWGGLPVCGRGVWVCELGLWGDMYAWLLLWCCVALCSLWNNSIGPEGAAAISRSLASVPQLRTLKYVAAACALVVRLRRWDPSAQGLRGWGGSVPAGCVGVGAGVPVCVVRHVCVVAPVVSCGAVQPGREQHRA